MIVVFTRPVPGGRLTNRRGCAVVLSLLASLWGVAGAAADGAAPAVATRQLLGKILGDGRSPAQRPMPALPWVASPCRALRRRRRR